MDFASSVANREVLLCLLDRLGVVSGQLIPQPEIVACIRAPPISSSVTFSPTTISAIRGDPRYIEAFASTMITMSQKDGM